MCWVGLCCVLLCFVVLCCVESSCVGLGYVVLGCDGYVVPFSGQMINVYFYPAILLHLVVLIPGTNSIFFTCIRILFTCCIQILFTCCIQFLVTWCIESLSHVVFESSSHFVFKSSSHVILESCCCLPTPMTIASGGSPMFPHVVHQPASPSIWPAVQ